MHPQLVPLYYLSSVAGLAMVIGGIWLIYKQKIYIDRESQQITEIETPVGKFKTNIPALALFILGFFPLIYPIVATQQFVEEVRIHGSIRSNTHPVIVYAVTQTDSLLRDGDFRLRVPFLRKGDGEYKILYLAQGKLIVDEERAIFSSAKSGEIQLPAKDFTLPPSSVVTYESKIQPVPSEFR